MLYPTELTAPEEFKNRERNVKFLPARTHAAKGILIVALVFSLIMAPSAQASCATYLAAFGTNLLKFSKKHRWKGYFLFFAYAGWKGLENSNVPSEDDEKYKHLYAYPRQGGVEWDSVATAGELMDAIRETEGMLDEVRRYAPDLGSYLEGSKVNQYSTGREEELHTWVLEQPNNSITPKSVFKKALQLHDGRIGAALLCTHELLRSEARFKSHYIRASFSKNDEEQAKFFNRFRDIRGDLVETGLGGGDHSGSWYRMFGVVLNSYGAAVGRDENGQLESESRTVDYALQKLEVTAAEWIKPVIRWPERDLGKAGFNRYSVDVGHQLLLKLADYGAELETQ